MAILRMGTEAGSLPALGAALALANRHHAYDIDSVQAILAMLAAGDGDIPGPLPAAQLERWPQAAVQAVDSAAYGALAAVAAGWDAQ